MNNFYDRYLFENFEIGNIKFPRILFGSSPFFGAGQFKNKSIIYYNQFYLNPQNITHLYNESISKGLNAIHIPSDPIIIQAVNKAIKLSSGNNFICTTIEVRNIQEELNLCKWIGADSIIVHGSYTDNRVDRLVDILRMIKEQFNGIPTGIATHSPGNIIPRVYGVKEVDIIMTPINSVGEFMLPDVDSTLKAIAEARRLGKKIIGMKTLAAGLLKPIEALKYLVDKVDGAVVGITSPQELYDLLNAGLKYFK